MVNGEREVTGGNWQISMEDGSDLIREISQVSVLKSLLPSSSLTTIKAWMSVSSVFIGLLIGESSKISKDDGSSFLISFTAFLSLAISAVVARLSVLRTLLSIGMVNKEGVSCFFAVTLSSLRVLRVISSFLLATNCFKAFKAETWELEVFCELLDDNPSSFLLSLELDLDLCLLLDVDFSSPLCLEGADEWCSALSFLLSLERDCELERDIDEDRPRL